MNPKLTVLQNGTRCWHLDSKLHRTDGPAIIEPDGSEKWYLNNEYHRIDGPAVIKVNEYEAWLQNNKLHCLDGPAIIYYNGCNEFWAFGVQYKSFEELTIGVIINR